MQDMLKRIIEMDEQARLVKEKAQNDKAVAEKDIIETKQKIYNDYIERAKDRVRKNLEIDKAAAENEFKIAKEKHQSTLKELEAIDKDNHDRWVEEIVNRVINN